MTLLQLCNDVLRRFWTVVSLVVCCAAGAALVSLARPRTFTSSASFVPEARQPLSVEAPGSGSSLEGLPGQALPGGSSRLPRLPSVGGTSTGFPPLAPAKALDPDFYYTMLLSREVLVEVAGSQFVISTPAGVQRGTAADLYGLPPGAPLNRTEDAAQRLTREMSISYEELTGVLTLSVRTFDPAFAQAVVARLLDVLMEHNRQMADIRAEAQVAFLTRAAQDARQELIVAQDRLARFLQSNRAYLPTSPLATAFARLDGDVLDKRRQYAGLALQLERAKLDRSRAIQLILKVAGPERPSGPDARGVVRATIVGAVGGGALALLLVLISAQLRRLRVAGSEDLSALEAEWRAVRKRAASAGLRATGSAAVTVVPGADG